MNSIVNFPKKNRYGNFFREDLVIRSFYLLKIYDKPNTYYVPVYVLTDLVLNNLDSFDEYCYETMVRIGFDDSFEFLTIQESCITELEAFRQHKLIYKKLKRHIYDNEIIGIIEKARVSLMNNV